jgi:imidazole glycerol phosphate synthase subunit HisF
MTKDSVSLLCVFRAPADKISINTNKRPEFIREASEEFGSTIVVSIEAIKPDGK